MLWCLKMCQGLFFCCLSDDSLLWCQSYLQTKLQHNSFQLFCSHVREQIAYCAPIQLFATPPPLNWTPCSSFFLSTSILTTGCYTLVLSGNQSALPCHVARDLGSFPLSPTSPFWKNQNARFQTWFDFIRCITINIKVKSSSVIDVWWNMLNISKCLIYLWCSWKDFLLTFIIFSSFTFHICNATLFIQCPQLHSENLFSNQISLQSWDLSRPSRPAVV